jgi:hypothetical protein
VAACADGGKGQNGDSHTRFNPCLRKRNELGWQWGSQSWLPPAFWPVPGLPESRLKGVCRQDACHTPAFP